MNKEELRKLSDAATGGKWEIGWYIATADNQEESDAGSVNVGDELWRAAKRIGPLQADHDHWAGWFIAWEEDALFAAACVNFVREVYLKDRVINRNPETGEEIPPYSEYPRR